MTGSNVLWFGIGIGIVFCALAAVFLGAAGLGERAYSSFGWAGLIGFVICWFLFAPLMAVVCLVAGIIFWFKFE